VLWREGEDNVKGKIGLSPPVLRGLSNVKEYNLTERNVI
jgi:hypothetical protein